MKEPLQKVLTALLYIGIVGIPIFLWNVPFTNFAQFAVAVVLFCVWLGMLIVGAVHITTALGYSKAIEEFLKGL